MKFTKEMSKDEFRNQMLNGETAEQQVDAIDEYVVSNIAKIEEQVHAEYRELKDVTDTVVLANRGIHTLTAEEKRYYNEVQKTKMFPEDELLPTTIVERVFDDLVKERPLLSLVRFLPGVGKQSVITSKRLGKAVWGPLHRDLEGQLDAIFDVTETTLHNLTAFFLVSNDTLDLGPTWIDRFVRLCLQEAVAEAWEEAIVAGDGDNQPIGLMKDLDGSRQGNAYPDKASSGTLTFGADSVVKELTKVMADLSTYEQEVGEETQVVHRKVTGRVNFLVNPADYYHIVNATTVRNANGVYVTNMPFVPVENIVESEFVPQGKLIAFLDDAYLAQTAYDNRIYEYKETFAMKRATLFAIDVFGEGRPVDNHSALVYDLAFDGATLEG